MKYRVIIEPPAAEEIESAFLFIAEHGSLARAQQWFNTLEEKLRTLASMPRRCPLAPEDEHFTEEIRQLLVSPYRAIFTIKAKSVHVLPVRHMAPRPSGGLGADPTE